MQQDQSAKWRSAPSSSILPFIEDTNAQMCPGWWDHKWTALCTGVNKDKCVSKVQCDPIPPAMFEDGLGCTRPCHICSVNMNAFWHILYIGLSRNDSMLSATEMKHLPWFNLSCIKNLITCAHWIYNYITTVGVRKKKRKKKNMEAQLDNLKFEIFVLISHTLTTL